jgi:uncharacterized protein
MASRFAPLSQLVLWLAAFIVVPRLAAQSAVAPDAERVIIARQVVQASGAEAAILKSIEMMLPLQRAQNPSIPATFWDRFAVKARADAGQLSDSLAPVYAARYSKAELEQLVTFYESAIGRRVVAEQTQIVQDSQQLGMRWGARIGAAIAVELANEGVLVGQ